MTGPLKRLWNWNIAVSGSVFTRFTLHPSQRLLIRPSDIDKQKQDLIQALPSTLRSAPLQDSIETVGKIIEPGSISKSILNRAASTCSLIYVDTP